MYLYLWILWCLLYPWSLIADAPFSLFPFSRRKLYLPSVDRPWPLSCERAKKDPVIFASRAVDLCVACDEPVETIYYSFWICSKESGLQDEWTASCWFIRSWVSLDMSGVRIPSHSLGWCAGCLRGLFWGQLCASDQPWHLLAPTEPAAVPLSLR